MGPGLGRTQWVGPGHVGLLGLTWQDSQLLPGNTVVQEAGKWVFRSGPKPSHVWGPQNLGLGLPLLVNHPPFLPGVAQAADNPLRAVLIWVYQPA